MAEACLPHTNIRIQSPKPIRFVRTAKEDLSAFPGTAKRQAGNELFMLQTGRNPDDWKPMPAVGAGTCEIRIADASGAFRVIYVAKFKDAIYVLHAFQKKTARTSSNDIKIAKRRYREAKRVSEVVAI